MCGIFGVVGTDVGFDEDRILSRLSNRGPDDYATMVDRPNQVFLAHRRLSIIDLTKRGRQPMSNDDGTAWLTFNGEVYNYRSLKKTLARSHRFQSRTDSEVVLHGHVEWGEDAIEKFNGQFAYGFWDQNRKKITLVRDRLGIKPLYYARWNGGLIFASEPKAILSVPGVPKTISEKGLTNYLMYRYFPEEQSIWKGIQQLKPGHRLSFRPDLDRLDVSQYWSLQYRNKRWERHEAIEKYNQLMMDSVKIRTISDVPLGVFLSGGLDSTSVTTALSRNVEDVKTFSIGFEGSANSELQDADLVARTLGTTHRTERVAMQNIETLKGLFRYFDEPLGDTSIIPTYLVSKVASRHVKVVLSGDGADELFGGYNWYRNFRFYRKFKWPGWVLNPLLQKLSGRKETLFRSSPDPFELYRQLVTPYFDFQKIKSLFPFLSPDDYYSDENYLYRKHYKRELPYYRRWQYVDTKTFLVSDILTKVDRASMAHSLEVRVPYLDHRLVEFAFSLPDRLCMRNGDSKSLIRQWLKPHFPEQITEKSKKGFSCPIEKYWPLEEMIDEVSNGQMIADGMLRERGWNEFLDSIPCINYKGKIWAMACLEKWYANWLA